MVRLKNRFRGVKQNLSMARAYWSAKVWSRIAKRSKQKFYNIGKERKYNAREKKNRDAEKVE
jgi:hypothetical protein